MPSSDHSGSAAHNTPNQNNYSKGKANQMGNTMSDGEAARVREREVPRQMGDIQEALEKLDNASRVLRDKLAPILKDNLVSPKDTGTKDKESLVPLANDLREFYHRINNILSTIGYLSEACEL